ncbi:hypothetical protein [Actinoplanes rectilineatus]|uniref:hypothetical protein n=1 Tax=Actinoplanes rectilineatus TaxID=113571 RepID=UPI000A8412EB|nr:hypothetical protein [Actinoplanes rectilineatus]
MRTVKSTVVVAGALVALVAGGTAGAETTGQPDGPTSGIPANGSLANGNTTADDPAVSNGAAGNSVNGEQSTAGSMSGELGSGRQANGGPASNNSATGTQTTGISVTGRHTNSDPVTGHAANSRPMSNDPAANGQTTGMSVTGSRANGGTAYGTRSTDVSANGARWNGGPVGGNQKDGKAATGGQAVGGTTNVGSASGGRRGGVSADDGTSAQGSVSSSSIDEIPGTVVPTGVMHAGGEIVLFLSPLNSSALPGIRFGVNAGLRAPSGQVKRLVGINEVNAPDVSPGFHAVHALADHSGVLVPEFGYYAGAATQITGKVGGKSFIARQHTLSVGGDTVVLFWFDLGAGAVSDLAATGADGKKLPTGNGEAGSG